MIELINITSDYKQSFNVVLNDGTKIFLKLEYRENQNAWFYYLQSGNFILSNQKLVCTTSLLYQFQNLLNFDLVVFSDDFNDPYFLEDFINNRIMIFIVSRSEATLLTAVYNQNHGI